MENLFEFDVELAQEKHYNEILEISNDVLGIDYVLNLTELSNSHNMIMAVAVERIHKKVIGFCFGKRVDAGKLGNEFPLFSETNWDSFIHRSNLSGTIGIVDPIGVHSSFQKRGIGKKMVEFISNSLIESGMTTLISPAWFFIENGKKRINAGQLLESVGFCPHTNVNSYWEKECGRDFICPIKTHVCSCGTIFYIKNI